MSSAPQATAGITHANGRHASPQTMAILYMTLISSGDISVLPLLALLQTHNGVFLSFIMLFPLVSPTI